MIVWRSAGDASVDSLHLKAWRSSTDLFDNVVEERLHTDAFDVQIHRTRWIESGEAIFSPSLSFIEMMLGSTTHVQGSYAHPDDPAKLTPLGNVSFMPRQSQLHCHVVPGSQRSVSCMFDIEKLADRNGIAWEWPDFDPDDALDVGNEYIRAGLRRIAEELVSPSFSAVAQIECSLMFIAMELRRVYGSRRDAAATTGRLTHGQLAKLCDMIIEKAGETPSLGELAAETGMSGRSLAAAVRNTTGETFRTFLANVRLEKAKMLLLDRHLLIKQIAYDCGFKSSASFAAAFHKAVGVTPAGYRSQTAG